MTDESKSKKTQNTPFRRAVLRGLAVAMPAILTVAVFFWAWNLIETNVLGPIEKAVTGIFYYSIRHVEDGVPEGTSQDQVWIRQRGTKEPLSTFLEDKPDLRRNIRTNNTNLPDLIDEHDAVIVSYRYQGVEYVPLNHGRYISRVVLETVRDDPGDVTLATATPLQVYTRYIKLTNPYLQRWISIPLFLLAFISFLYFTGRFLAKGVGRMAWNQFEGIVHRLPIVRQVYSSVKQVTDFVFTEQDIQFNRVVAVEYPRKGIWSIGFVTGESMLDIQSAANEPVLSVLMPTSPMPATGFIVTVRKSETIDLNLTVDQAIQFIVSCGVVVPEHQRTDLARAGVPTLPAGTDGAQLGERKSNDPGAAGGMAQVKRLPVNGTAKEPPASSETGQRASAEEAADRDED